MVRQAAQREATLAKKKKIEKAWRRFDKEKEINQRVRGGKRRSDVEAELESVEPTEMGDDVSSLEDEEDRGIVVTLVQRREPVAAHIGGGHGTFLS